MRVANNQLLAPRHWSLIAEAGAALAAASAATRLLPFKRFIKLGALPVRRSKPLDKLELAQMIRAMKAAKTNDCFRLKPDPTSAAIPPTRGRFAPAEK